MAGILLGILLLLAALVFAVRIKEIKVTGNSHYTEEQVIDLVLGGKWSRNSAFCYYENRFREHKSIPFIEEYKIEFKSPTKIEIVVFEKSVVGYVSYMSSYMYFDKDGIIVESSVAASRRAVDHRTGFRPYYPAPAPSCGRSRYLWGDLKSDPGAVGP